MRRRGIITAIATLAGLAALIWAPGAMALGLTDLSAAPTNLAAGAHSDFKVHIGVTEQTDDIKDLTIHLPPGMVGDPTGPTVCTVEDLNADACADTSQVGTSSSNALLLDLVPLTVSGEIFNITAQEGEPARFGIVLHPPVGSPIVLQSAAQLRGNDFGLDTVLNDLPNTANGLGISITSLDITLFGTANGQSFMRNPTSCDAKTVTFEATSYAGGQDEPVTGSAPSFTPTDCDQLPFSPDLSAEIGAPGLTDTDTHPPLTTVIEQDETEAGLKRAEVILPASTQPNNNALGHQCLEADFDAGNCAANTTIGSAVASSPLLTVPLTGNAYLLQRGGGLGVGLDLQGPLALKLKGSFVFTPELRTGNLFEGLPDIPISEFALTIDGGANGLLTAARDLCDPPASVLDATFDGHNGAHLVQSPEATIAGCAPPSPPTAKIKLRKPNSKKPALDLDIEAGSEPVELARLRIPKGFRFATGAAFTDGAEATVDGSTADDDILSATRRRVTADPSGADDSLELSVGDGALRRVEGRPKPFRVKVIDGDDQTFRFRLKP
jgi:hypothetical protein